VKDDVIASADGAEIGDGPGQMQRWRAGWAGAGAAGERGNEQGNIECNGAVLDGGTRELHWSQASILVVGYHLG
jgi:hypothetical protein